jgi:hypothetical protein
MDFYNSVLTQALLRKAFAKTSSPFAEAVGMRAPKSTTVSNSAIFSPLASSQIATRRSNALTTARWHFHVVGTS